MSRKKVNHALLVVASGFMVLATGFLYLTYFTGEAMAAASVGGPTRVLGCSITAVWPDTRSVHLLLATALFAVALLVRRVLRLEDMRDLTPWIPVSFFVVFTPRSVLACPDGPSWCNACARTVAQFDWLLIWGERK